MSIFDIIGAVSVIFCALVIVVCAAKAEKDLEEADWPDVHGTSTPPQQSLAEFIGMLRERRMEDETPEVLNALKVEHANHILDEQGQPPLEVMPEPNLCVICGDLLPSGHPQDEGVCITCEDELEMEDIEA